MCSQEGLGEFNMRPLRPYHHFRNDRIEASDRVAKCERLVVDKLLGSSLPDSRRESSVAWELKHEAGVAQMARLLARKRGLAVDLCTVGGILHDIYVIVEGKYEDHAHRGAPIAKAILDEIGLFSEEETARILKVVYHHSDKHIWTSDGFAELGKDADTLDCLLYPDALQYYLGNKRLEIFRHYLKRAQRLWDEFNLPQEPALALLDNYGPQWFQRIAAWPGNDALEQLESFLALMLVLTEMQLYPPAYCLVLKGNGDASVWSNLDNWQDFQERCRSYKDLGPENSDAMVRAIGHLAQGDALGRPSGLLSGSARFVPPRQEAARILRDSRTSDRRALVVWPAIETYEEYAGSTVDARLGELGVSV